MHSIVVLFKSAVFLFYLLTDLRVCVCPPRKENKSYNASVNYRKSNLCETSLPLYIYFCYRRYKQIKARALSE